MRFSLYQKDAPDVLISTDVMTERQSVFEEEMRRTLIMVTVTNQSAQEMRFWCRVMPIKGPLTGTDKGNVLSVKQIKLQEMEDARNALTIRLFKMESVSSRLVELSRLS